MDHYGVIGNPIHHSQSPFIFKRFAQQTHQSLSYEPMLVAVDGLKQALADFSAQQYRGINVTLPFKQQAAALVTTLSERAKRAEAVNTITFHEDGSCSGDNTDGVGLIRDITQNLRTPLQGKRVLVLGAGGAVRGVIGPILDESPSELTIANRTVSKAMALVEAFPGKHPLHVASFSALAEEHPFDILINGTSASLHKEGLVLPSGIVASGALCYDMVYGQGNTLFLQWAKAEGAAHTHDGIGMLVEQAAEAYFLWRGIRPETRSVLEAFLFT